MFKTSVYSLASIAFALTACFVDDPPVFDPSATTSGTTHEPTVSTDPGVPTTSADPSASVTSSDLTDTDGVITGTKEDTSGSSSSSTGDTINACKPGEQVSCYYTGPEGTEDVGDCHGGIKTCLGDGSGFSPCEGEVLPQHTEEVCSDPQADDPDCDGFNGCSGTGQWIHAFGEFEVANDTPGQSRILQIATDAQGNVFYAGDFEDNLEIGDSAFIDSTNGMDYYSRDCFVGKIEPNGTLLWRWQIESSSHGTLAIRGITVDQNGNVFIVADLGTSIKIGEQVLESEAQDEALNWNMYIIKLDGTTGKVLWFHTIDATLPNDEGILVTQEATLAVDQNGDVIVIGAYTGGTMPKIMIAQQPFFMVSGYAAKFDGNDGSLIWTQFHKGDDAIFYRSAVRKNNQVLWAVSFFDNFEIDGQQFSSERDALLFTVDSQTGKATLLQTYKDADPQDFPAFQIIQSIAVDEQDNIILGTVEGILEAGQVSQIGNLLVPSVNKGYESTVIKLNPQGQPLWHQHFSALPESSLSDVFVSAVAVDSSDNIVLTGIFSDSMVVDEQSWKVEWNDLSRTFVVKLNPLMNVLWGKYYNNDCGYCSGVSSSIAIDPANHILVGGDFRGAFKVDQLVSVNTVENYDYADAFVMKLTP